MCPIVINITSSKGVAKEYAVGGYLWQVEMGWQSV
jgi:hypothetical protein